MFLKSDLPWPDEIVEGETKDKRKLVDMQAPEDRWIDRWIDRRTDDTQRDGSISHQFWF